MLANRLSEDARNSVLLLEAGPEDRRRWDSWKIQMPAALTYNLADERYNWSVALAGLRSKEGAGPANE